MLYNVFFYFPSKLKEEMLGSIILLHIKMKQKDIKNCSTIQILTFSSHTNEKEMVLAFLQHTKR